MACNCKSVSQVYKEERERILKEKEEQKEAANSEDNKKDEKLLQ